MDLKSVSLPIPNAIFFIAGTEARDIPHIERGSVIWSADACIAVGCTPDVDGETTISIGPFEQISLTDEPAFDGELETASKIVNVEIVPGKRILQEQVAGVKTRIRIWINHPTEPDNVTIGLG
jgi:hypothetical protein